MANVPVSGYPTPIGSKTRMTFDHTGPASYSNIGTNSGTGDVINASDLGFGGFDSLAPAFGGFVEAYSQSGNFIVKMFTGSTGTTPSQSIPSGGAFPKVVLQWFTTAAAFGAISTEVANTTSLVAESFRLEATVV